MLKLPIELRGTAVVLIIYCGFVISSETIHIKKNRLLQL